MGAVAVAAGLAAVIPTSSTADGTVAISEFPGLTAGSRAGSLVSGPDGALWVAETAGRIARVTPQGSVVEYSQGITPLHDPQHDLGPYQIATGPDHNLWFTEPTANLIGRITPAGTVTEFSSGISAGATPVGIVAGPDGNLWFTETNGDRIGRITPNGTVTEYQSGITSGAHPWGITAGPDGNLWFTEIGLDGVARITTDGGVSEFFVGITPGAGPAQITTGPDGNLWSAEYTGDRIARTTPTGRTTEFSTGITPGASPGGIVAGPDQSLWFAEPFGNRVARITTAGLVTEFSAGISAGSEPSGMTAAADGSVWFTELGGDRVARLTSVPAPITPIPTATATVGPCPPAGRVDGRPVGVTVENTARYTNDPNVALTIVAPDGAGGLLISNDGGFTRPFTAPLQPSHRYTWTLDSSGPERLPKTVYVRFSGACVDASQTFQDDIILDQTPPRLPTPTLRPAKGRGRSELQLKAVDNASGVSRVEVRRAKVRIFAATYRRTVRLKGASRNISVRVRDGAGNFSGWHKAKVAKPRR